jgi:DNA polymerase III subunit epsilon
MKMLTQDGIDEMIKRIECDGNHLVLRRLALPVGRTAVPYHGGNTMIGLVVDVETTGKDYCSDLIIELALRRFRYDKSGRILKVDSAWCWREDPGQPLSSEIVRLTGLQDNDLVGQRIDDADAVRLLTSAHLIIAHNAAFDRKFVERRLPQAAGMPWACSCSEIDWRAAGFDGRSLGWLMTQAGWFFDGHRALNDVDAVIMLLWHRLKDGSTILAELIDRAACPSVRVEAIGASFAVKDALRLRGYKWDSSGRTWWREVQATDLPDEESWLGLNVYVTGAGSTGTAPRLTALTARERYA